MIYVYILIRELKVKIKLKVINIYICKKSNKNNGPPYPEVTVVNLPSSLIIVHSNAFVYSTCLLVLVSRYGLFEMI